jgi:hypothetical protein
VWKGIYTSIYKQLQSTPPLLNIVCISSPSHLQVISPSQSRSRYQQISRPSDTPNPIHPSIHHTSIHTSTHPAVHIDIRQTQPTGFSNRSSDLLGYRASDPHADLHRFNDSTHSTSSVTTTKLNRGINHFRASKVTQQTTTPSIFNSTKQRTSIPIQQYTLDNPSITLKANRNTNNNNVKPLIKSIPRPPLPLPHLHLRILLTNHSIPIP